MKPTAALQFCEQRCAAAEAALAASDAVVVALRQALAISRARELQARRAAQRDALTGLPNRAGFSQRAARTLHAHAAQSLGFCVLFIDLDGFKQVNDTLGHAVGDALLRVIAARLAHAVRSEDRVSRHGGDEFVCVLPQVQQDDHALAIGRKLIDAVSAPCVLGPLTVQVGASVGMALYPRDGDSVQALVDCADQAMLWAKQQRRGLGLAGQRPRLLLA